MPTQTKLDLSRIASQIDVILTQIFRRYVAQGSPTKLGGLRFLDRESSKTFAFEKTETADDGVGSLLLFSAPYASIDQDKDPSEVTDKRVVETDALERVKREVSQILSQGPHGEAVRHLSVRPSKDAGKSDRFFIEVGYYIPTSEWLTDEAIIAYAQEHRLTDTNKVLVRILEEKVLPIADEIMQFLIHNLRSVQARA